MQSESLQLYGQGIWDYIVLAIFAAVTIWIAFTKPYRIIYILPACLTFYFFIEMGTRWTPEKIVPPIFILSLILNPHVKFNLEIFKDSWFRSFLIVVFMATIWGLFSSENYAILEGKNFSFQSPFFRTIIQMFTYLNYLLIYSIIWYNSQNIDRILSFFRFYIGTTTFLCLYAGYQILAYNISLPFRGIVYNADKVGIGAFKSAEDLIFRVNSFCIEPKQFSITLAISIILLIVSLDIHQKQFEIKLFSRNFLSYFLILIHSICFFLTYSSSTYISVSIFVIFYLMINISKNGFSKSVNLIMLCIVVFLIIYLLFDLKFFDDIFQSRISNQLNTRRLEYYALDLILRKPELIVFGVGLGNYNFLLNQEFAGSAGVFEGGFLDVLSSHLLTILFDIGLVGASILWFPALKLVLNYTNRLFDSYKNNSIYIYDIFSYLFLGLFFIAIFLNPTSTYLAFLAAFRSLNGRRLFPSSNNY
ncbi:hypothetical protein VB774_04750 [Pseudanabaena galeata UHCC 0370]|uniref:O-antigen polymerase n=1 Tax=Pseudanabaena galeata UHCC 0370 TaxID=3110310 RepID=A0ABU5TGZ5_9CYAN|nr:hypothetical protein [Pseudanabaena galeata]MEA5476923.1 hypothetical protein [Pseudanabaena galeata UHCC 0370]